MSKSSKPHIKPLGGRVLVKMVDAGEQIVGGIVIPGTAQEKPQEAEVVALGTGRVDDSGKVHSFNVKVGDRVIVSKYGGTEVKVGEHKYTIVSEDDILGVLA